MHCWRARAVGCLGYFGKLTLFGHTQETRRRRAPHNANTAHEAPRKRAPRTMRIAHEVLRKRALHHMITYTLERLGRDEYHTPQRLAPQHGIHNERSDGFFTKLVCLIAHSLRSSPFQSPLCIASADSLGSITLYLRCPWFPSLWKYQLSIF